MESEIAKFRVHETFHITGRQATYISGKIRSGTVKKGMKALVWLGSGLFLEATVCDISPIRDTSGESDIALGLEAPDDETRELWKELCRKGDTISIKSSEEANQSPQTRSTSGPV